MAWRNVRLIVVGFIFFLCAPVQAQQENEGTAPNADVSKLYGEGEPNVATALTNLAEQYKAQGRYADAEPLYQRSLAIREKGLGPDHPDVATALNNLADLYLSQGRYADAEPLYERAVAIYEKALGPDQPDAKAAAVAAAAPTSAPDSPENDSVAVDKKEETAAPTNAATPEEPAPLPTGGQATTEYYGGAEPPTTPAWAAKATMNPDYKTEETLAPEAAAAAEEPAPPPTGGQATTEYYGGTESPTNPAWAAEATMNPDYKNEETAPPTTAAATEEPAPLRPARKLRRNITAALNRRRIRLGLPKPR